MGPDNKKKNIFYLSATQLFEGTKKINLKSYAFLKNPLLSLLNIYQVFQVMSNKK